MNLTEVKMYQSAQTRMDLEKKFKDAAKFEVMTRLERRFPKRQIEESDIHLIDIKIKTISDCYFRFKKPERTYTAQFFYQGEYYNLESADNIHFESNDLKIKEYYLPDHLKTLENKITRQENRKINLRNIAIETYETKDVPSKKHTEYNPDRETLYRFEVLVGNNIYEFCFDKEGHARNFDENYEEKK